MTLLHPADELAAILAHYVRVPIERSGLKWTEANDRDFARVAELLDTLLAPAPDSDTMPPYHVPAPAQIESRVTQVLSQEQQQLHDFELWRQQRAEDERHEQARRIMRRR